MPPIIETHALTKCYGKARGIEAVDLRVESGEVFGFIGPNGAGKSTTIRALLGLIAITSGSASVLGLPVQPGQVAHLKDIGYMPGESHFEPWMKAGDVIAYSASLRGRDCARRAAELIRRFEVDTHKKVAALSLGNRKKLSLICALQHEPRLLLLDEPTSGLDPLMQAVFWEELGRAHQAGATVFLSSHVLSEVQRHCHRAAIIREGRIVSLGSVDALAGAAGQRVTLIGPSQSPQLPGVQQAQPIEGGVSFLYQGEAGPLLQALAALPIDKVHIADLDLDEVFMHFYQGGDGHAGA